MKSRYAFLFAAVLLFACGTAKNGNQADGKDKDNAHPSLFEDLAEGDSLFASIKKGYCFGKCPVYEMHIYNTGFIMYQGTANVELLGTHTGWATKEQLQVLLDKASEIGYFQMADEYDNPGVTDLPETTTSLVMNGARKTVRRRYGYPSTIVAFEKTFETLINQIKWSPGLATE